MRLWCSQWHALFYRQDGAQPDQPITRLDEALHPSVSLTSSQTRQCVAQLSRPIGGLLAESTDMSRVPVVVHAMMPLLLRDI